MAEQRSKKGPGKSTSGGASKPKAKSKSSNPEANSSSGTAQTKRSVAAKKGAQTRRRAATKRSTAAKKGAATRAKSERSASAKQAARTRESSSPDIAAKTAEEMREAISKNLIDPLGLVMLTRERIEEAVSDAVTRGRVTADDAQELVAALIDRGRRQTNDVLGDLEQLLGRGRDEIERTTTPLRKGTDAARRARQGVEGATTRARKEAVDRADPVIAQADRARRVAGLGPSFPIIGYDELTVAQVQGRLDGLSPAELRKVRDYERRHANRKTVLNAIGEKLA
ncbi:MAG: hypothetical protein H0U32_04815 [Thermoleophilaceae bacterium]|nr:hypothetical protein [Thermoleophilaceae bacterium]